MNGVCTPNQVLQMLTKKKKKKKKKKNRSQHLYTADQKTVGRLGTKLVSFGLRSMDVVVSKKIRAITVGAKFLFQCNSFTMWRVVSTMD